MRAMTSCKDLTCDTFVSRCFSLYYRLRKHTVTITIVNFIISIHNSSYGHKLTLSLFATWFPGFLVLTTYQKQKEESKTCPRFFKYILSSHCFHYCVTKHCWARGLRIASKALFESFRTYKLKIHLHLNFKIALLYAQEWFEQLNCTLRSNATFVRYKRSLFRTQKTKAQIISETSFFTNWF